ncbi:MAG: GcrA cell cycle regulator [Caulobacterales bacterium]|nr:GcrA cell cycle regulator [Caulobacterales bacterium]
MTASTVTEADIEAARKEYGWTDRRKTVTKALWLDGFSAAQIAKRIGGCSRNAVIGIIHRSGLSGREAPSKPSRPLTPRPARPATPPTPTSPSAGVHGRADQTPEHRHGMNFRNPGSAPSTGPKPPSMPAARREEPGSATVLTLGAHMCKWPIGDPAHADFTFCGRRQGGVGPYCVEHAQVAYQSATQGTRKTATASELARSLRRYI